MSTKCSVIVYLQRVTRVFAVFQMQSLSAVWDALSICSVCVRDAVCIYGVG